MLGEIIKVNEAEYEVFVMLIVKGEMGSFFVHFLIAIALSIVLSATANAQSCTSADNETRAKYQKASIEALMRGDLTRYNSLQLALPEGLSSSCNRYLDQSEPMRVNCSVKEKSVVLKHHQNTLEATLQLDFERIFDLMISLEQTLSSQCWLAVNRHTDPQIQRACSGSELDHVASFVSPMWRALRNFNVSKMMQLRTEVYKPLSQNCSNALVQLEQAQMLANQQASGGMAAPGLPNVIDHGGGTLSVPGLGACTPSGCIAY